MKVKSDEEIMKLIEMSRAKGALTFLSEHPRGDQQKVYRVLAKMDPLPLFEGEYEFTVRAHKDSVTIERKVKETTIIVDSPKQQQQPQQPKQKQRKEPLWMIKWKTIIAKAEENPLFIKGNPECYDSWRYFDAVKTAMGLWTEGDKELEEALRGSYELFHKHLASAFGYEVEEPELADNPSTLQERIVRLVKVLGELDPKDPDYNRVLNEKDRLVKLRDEEQWKPGADLLG